MIFAAETETLTLYVFDSEASAVAYCEGLDVEAATWLFWNDAGLPLEPEFIVPNVRGLFTIGNGKYRLIPAGENHHAGLSEALGHIKYVESEPPLNTVEAIAHYLAANHS
jgi:hypothetical protein